MNVSVSHSTTRPKNWQTGQQTLFQVGILGPNTLQAGDSPNLSISKELEEAGEKPDTSVSSVGATISMYPLYDGSMTGEELHHDRSEFTNANTVIRLDIGCITDEVPTQAEMEKYIAIGHISLPKQLPNDLDKHTFPEIPITIFCTNI